MYTIRTKKYNSTSQIWYFHTNHRNDSTTTFNNAYTNKKIKNQKKKLELNVNEFRTNDAINTANVFYIKYRTSNTKLNIQFNDSHSLKSNQSIATIFTTNKFRCLCYTANFGIWFSIIKKTHFFGLDTRDSREQKIFKSSAIDVTMYH